MLHPAFYNMENARRLRSAQIGITVVSALVCVYMAATALMSMRDVWTMQAMLRRGKGESANLSREVRHQERQEARQAAASDGGVGVFAVKLSAWAAARKVHVESYVPEGAPNATQVTVDGSDLGIWNANRVRVKGKGGFAELMGLLDQLRTPDFPVRLDAFSFQSSRSGDKCAISFDLVLTVYEKKSDAG